MSTIRERVLPVICETFEVAVNEISLGTPLGELGDNLSQLALLFELEAAFGISVDEAEFEANCGNVGDVVDLVEVKVIAREAA